MNSVFSLLSRECEPGSNPVLADPAYRRHLAVAAFYKFILSLLGDGAPKRAKSGSSPIDDTRGTSSGTYTLPK